MKQQPNSGDEERLHAADHRGGGKPVWCYGILPPNHWPSRPKVSNAHNLRQCLLLLMLNGGNDEVRIKPRDPILLRNAK